MAGQTTHGRLFAATAAALAALTALQAWSLLRAPAAWSPPPLTSASRPASKPRWARTSWQRRRPSVRTFS